MGTCFNTQCKYIIENKCSVNKDIRCLQQISEKTAKEEGIISHLKATDRQNMAPKGSGPDIATLVQQDIEARAVMGEKKYGERLKGFNGRNSLLDLYQEILDAANYCKQKLIEDEASFKIAFNELANLIHQNAVSKGFWDYNESEYVSFYKNISLIHAELSEAVEAMRHGNKPSEHIPEFSGLEEEFADTIIRILDYSVAHKLRLFDAIQAKIKYNSGREHMYGGKLF